uniref:Uncharacterized protein n=1 Tax=Schistosoma japonicum TaxID=6182 RepID=Q5BXE4_SCHJA|nr:unknown [Schistosoma japonicum]
MYLLNVVSVITSALLLSAFEKRSTVIKIHLILRSQLLPLYLSTS